MTTGIFIGKFLPPHRGHITSILTAHALCDKLYVIVCNRDVEDAVLCRTNNIKPISGVIRKQWMSQELQGFDNIHILIIDESKVPSWPNGWEGISKLIKKAVPEPIDIIFGGEMEYAKGFGTHFPESYYKVIYPEHSAWPISATKIRENPLKHWDYILGAARPFFTKKVLITGTESCGKTTLVKKLAKIYNTSWSEEVGRSYAERYLGGDETAFTDYDFERIAHLQFENDYDTLRHANRICFFDTDATVTDYYSKLYLGHSNKKVRSYINLSQYDLIFIMTPSVPWVDDGMRLHGENRWSLHDKLWVRYVDHPNACMINGDYNTRMNRCMTRIDIILNIGEH